MDNPQKERLTIYLTAAVFMAGQTIAAIWWAATINANLKSLQDTTNDNRATIARIEQRADPNPLQDQVIGMNVQRITDLEARMRVLERAKP